MLIQSRRLLEAVRQEGGAGGAPAAPAAAPAAPPASPAAAPAEWLKPFGEHGKAFESFKEPAELATKWTELNTELTALKGKQTEDWRKLLGDDEAVQKDAARYTDPKAYAKAKLEAAAKIRSGELAKPLAKDAKPEEVKAWREANGIPADQKEYWANMPDGIVIGKDDQPFFDTYGAIFHKHNASPALAHEIAKTYYEQEAVIAKEDAKLDQADHQKAISALRNEMGPDYDTNKAIYDNWLESFGEGKDLFKDAILADGTRLRNSPAHMKVLMGIARQMNPAAHLLPAGGEGNMKNIDTEIADIKKLMGDPRSDYYKGPKSAAIQKRYKELITAREALGGRK
jgi:hypothetical protein